MSRTDHPRKRRRFSPAALAIVWARQKGLCACGCKEALIVGQVDYDHQRPLSMGGDDTLENLRALIRKHHLAKTRAEATVRAKMDRAGAKHRGEWLKADDRELQRIRERTRQVER